MIAVKCLEARCLIPRLDGVILSLEWKEALWDRFVMAAPRPRTLSEQRHSDRRAEPGTGDKSQDGGEVAEAQNS